MDVQEPAQCQDEDRTVDHVPDGVLELGRPVGQVHEDQQQATRRLKRPAIAGEHRCDEPAVHHGGRVSPHPEYGNEDDDKEDGGAESHTRGRVCRASFAQYEASLTRSSTVLTILSPNFQLF